MRDKDCFICKCGEVLHEWNGTESFSFTLIEGPSTDKDR